mmetsp:Transcript_19684/g.55657  ORF Transcript_19684/g.55657 Transcript_19684/m.55657 type:complete len:96 (+) Transcript_19684:789-1076(+)|eukprot:scaffold148588_cov33-Tisochrysis_lutea.AAC.2
MSHLHETVFLWTVARSNQTKGAEHFDVVVVLRYSIMTEWDEMQMEEEVEKIRDDGSVVTQRVLVRRKDEESWTIVTWQLSLHSGAWLTDSLNITE